MQKNALSLFFLFFSGAFLWAELSFSGGVINQNDEVLFAIDTAIPSMPRYRTLFRKDLKTGNIEQLTFFPEEMHLVSGGNVLQIKNRFGTVSYDFLSRQFSAIEASSLETGSSALEKAAASPDGKWIAAIAPFSPSRGKIVLMDAEGRSSVELSSSASRGKLPFSWSPDSSMLIYEDSGSIYYARPETIFSGSPLQREYCWIGEGSVNSIAWHDASRFFYARGDSLYRVQSLELFGRSIYGALISPGEFAGRLPIPFNPEEDRIYSSPDGKSMLFVSGSRCVYYLGERGSPAILFLPGSTAEVIPCWTQSASPVVFARTIENGERAVKGWAASAAGGSAVFAPLSVPEDALRVIISPDGNYAAFMGSGGISVYSISEWAKAADYASSAVCAVWIDSDSMFIGGSATVSRWNFKTGASEMITVSSVSGFNWDEQGRTPVAFVGANFADDALFASARFRYTGAMKWELAAGTRAGAPATENLRYRLYLDSFDGAYSNMLYVRDAEGAGRTAPIVPLPHESREADSGGGSAAVALVFDAMDDASGLPLVLDALADYGFKATFFINGEFLRRHPEAASAIVKAGHHAASMFFTTWDLSSAEFSVDAEFIRRGLARNEDDFHRVTGAELSLFWHAPYYVVSPEIIEGGSLAGYKHVQQDIFVPDWITRESPGAAYGLYKDSDTIIEEIMEKVKPGDVIPIRIGKPARGNRDDYLYSRIRTILNALLERGFAVVPVSGL